MDIESIKFLCVCGETHTPTFDSTNCFVLRETKTLIHNGSGGGNGAEVWARR